MSKSKLREVLDDPVLLQEMLNTPVSVDSIISITRRRDYESYAHYQNRMNTFASLLRHQMEIGIIVNQGEHLKFVEDFFPDFDHTGQSGTYTIRLITLS